MDRAWNPGCPEFELATMVAMKHKEADGAESPNTLQALDALLAGVGLRHGRRSLRAAGFVPQARHPRQEVPPAQPREPVRAGVLRILEARVLREAGVRHAFSTRTGGVSDAFLPGGSDAARDGQGELNLGFAALDTPENVRENRSRYLREVFGEARPVATLQQVHSSLIRRVERAEDGRQATPLKGDGLMTGQAGLVLGIGTADCVPVLVADRETGAVAAFHAGWRGTLRRIVEGGVGRMRLEFGAKPENLVAAIGPSIGQCCYAVGDEVEAEFRSQFPYADELFREVYDQDPVKKKYPMLFLNQRAPGHGDMGPGLHLDLAEANRRQLLHAGLRAESVEVLRYCTSCRGDLFFSYRAEHGRTGRMLAVIEARQRRA